MDERIDTEYQVTANDMNDRLDIHLTYANLLLKHSYNQKINLSDGRLTSTDENYSDYYFDIELSTYKKLKNIRADYKVEYEKREYNGYILSLERDYVKITVKDFPREIEIIKKAIIVVNMRFIIERQKNALERLSLPELEGKRNTIFGNTDISGGRFIECDFKSLTPNEKQKISIQHAVGVKDIYLIWGPPGTGKTAVVPDIVRNYVRVQKEKGNPKPRVLMCSYTNTAVDNIAKKLFDNNDFKSKIVRFGRSILKGVYKEICLDEIIREETRGLDEKLTGEKDRFKENKKILEVEEKTHVNQLNTINNKIKFQEGKRSEVEKNIISLENQKRQREDQLILNHLEKKRKETENRVIQDSNKLEELSRNESLILDQINKTESEISGIERDIIDYSDVIAALEKDEHDNGNLIKIVEVYLKASKKNKISALFTKTKFKWRDPLYNRYEREMEKLRINEMNFRELESLSAGLIVERDNIQKRTTETKNKLKEAKKGREEKTAEVRGWEVEQASLKKEISELTIKLEGDNKELESIYEQINSEYIQLTNSELQQINLKNDKRLSKIESGLNEQNRSLDNYNKTLDYLGSEQKLYLDKIKDINKKKKNITKSFERLKSEIGKGKDVLIAQVLHGRTIIATTNLMACHKALHDINFDLVIMDESGAIDLLGAVIPLLKTDKVVFLGDPKQLPPVIVKNNNEIKNFLDEHPELEKSIFEIFYERCSDKDNKDKVVMLKKQYRMRREISDFVSATFYGNKLEHDESNGGYVLEENDDPLLDIHHPMLCLLRSFYTKYEDKSGYCIGELKIIKNIIENFRDVYGKNIINKIAVITPFRAQADMIKKEIPDVECGTVHTFQGQEKEIVIYSTVKYQPNSDGTFGRLLDSEKSIRLLNVAVSRAREKFIIIGCGKLFNDVEVYKKLYGYIEGHGDVIKTKLEGYDEQNTCKSCGKNIGDRYEYCLDCMRIQRMQTFIEDKPRQFKAMDGDLLRSDHEVRIDDWLYNRGIEHIVEKRLPTLKYCDWFLPKGDTFTHDIYVEYWGCMGDKDYEEGRKAKEKLYRRQKLVLLSIEPGDMKALDEILEHKLKKYRVSRERLLK